MAGFAITLTAGRETEWQSTLASLFSETARRFPDRRALLHQGGALTYRELDLITNRIGHRLAALIDRPGTPIGLCGETSPATIAALIGIVKAGGAYVPFDPSYPASLLAFIHRDSAPSAMLVSRRQYEQIDGTPFWSGPALVIEDLLAEATGPAEAPPARGEPGDLAYIMYTSGSTGHPKGVMVPHRAIARLVRRTNYVELGPDDIILQQAPLSFDASTFEIWGALLNGGALALPPGGRASLDDIAAAVRQFGVTTMWLTAGLFHLMVEHQLPALAGLRQLLAGGDVLNPTLVRRFVDTVPQCRLINGYGPTENTTFTCCHTVTAAAAASQGTVPIGVPIAGTYVYVLDEDRRPVAPGEPGELYAGGLGLALGYLNRPELNAAKFVADPFADDASVRLYRTGDRVRQRPDGALEFLGRTDRQIKINGKRVELEEIEEAVRRSGLVGEVAALARDLPTGQKGIELFVAPVAEPAGRITVEGAIRGFFAAEMPDYMMPARITVMDRLPLSPTGKIDRSQLQALSTERQGAVPPAVPSSIAARPADTLDRVARAWCQVLGESVSPDKNFFDVGGTSLQLIAVHATLERDLGRGLPLIGLFEHPTIRALAKWLDAGAPSEADRANQHDRASKRNAMLARARQQLRPGYPS